MSQLYGKFRKSILRFLQTLVLIYKFILAIQSICFIYSLFNKLLTMKCTIFNFFFCMPHQILRVKRDFTPTRFLIRMPREVHTYMVPHEFSSKLLLHANYSTCFANCRHTIEINRKIFTY